MNASGVVKWEGKGSKDKTGKAAAVGKDHKNGKNSNKNKATPFQVFNKRKMHNAYFHFQ